MRTALLWVIMQRADVIIYQCNICCMFSSG